MSDPYPPRRVEPDPDDYQTDEVDCTHCDGRGYHGTGAIFDEETRRWYPTDCGCCAGRGYHVGRRRCFS
jgi:hypothetical protein